MRPRLRALAPIALALGLLVGLPGGHAAPGAGACPDFVHITDGTGDADPTVIGLDTDEADIVRACVRDETVTHFVLVIEVLSIINPTATQTLHFTFSFDINGTRETAGANVASGGTVTATGKASSGSISGAALTINVPKAGVGYEPNLLGAQISDMRVTSGSSTQPGDPAVIQASDSAPGSGTSDPYTIGSYAPPEQDTDFDGIPDSQELAEGTDPLNPDEDGDGLKGGDNVTVAPTSDAAAFFLARGLHFVNESGQYTFVGEASLGTNASLADTDGDGLLDGPTVTVNPTSPRGRLLANSTGIPIPADRIRFNATQGNNTDPSGTFVTYAGELSVGTNATNPDTDGDGLSDGDEVAGTGNPYTGLQGVPGFAGSTNPLVADGDGDGLTDAQEIQGNANGTAFSPTDPNNIDTDGDGITDFEEVMGRLRDGTPFARTDPTKEDSDGDGDSDLAEIDAGTNPRDPNDRIVLVKDPDEQNVEWVYALLSTALLASMVVVAVLGILVRWG